MRPHIRSRLFLFVVLTAGALVATTGATNSSTAPQKPAENDAVRALLKERLAALQKIHDLATVAYNSGQLPLTETLAAHTSLLKGQLDLCETKAERVKVHEGMVQVADELLKSVRKLAEVKQATGVDLLKAEALAFYGLERAKAAK